ncbi:MAG: pseudouridine synthase [Azoarcus sp.]|nr:pseudouridine synthase [Azoarcus sp.]
MSTPRISRRTPLRPPNKSKAQFVWPDRQDSKPGSLDDDTRGKPGGRLNRRGTQIPRDGGGEPERLQKALARAGVASRRQIEEWVEEGRILVNDQPASLGQKIGKGDRVKLNGRLIRLRFDARSPRVLIYHKPEGEIVSRSDPQDRPSVFERLPVLRRGRWLAIGRLDFNTSGLLLFTDDGNLANRMMHPRYGFEREYAVRLLGELGDEQIRALTEGIVLEDGPARFSSLRAEGGEGANRWYRVVLPEGRNREVRRMFESVGFTVSRLMRVRYGPVELPPRLKRGMWMEMPEADACRLAGLPVPQKSGAEKERPPKLRRTMVRK